jgi:hypothetical protein
VAVRELRERWLLFPAAVVFGFNPLVFPAFGVDRQVMPLVAVATSVGLGAAAAVVIGSAMLARDAANGRLGFLFSRPLSWPTIWGGKWLAALLLVTITGALAAIPFMAVYPPRHGGPWVGVLADGRGWAFFICLFVLVVGLTNFVATAFRSRSPWLVLEMVLAGAGLWIARHYVAPLWRYGIVGGGGWAVAAALVPLALALFAGSAAQAAVGRTDVRRAHGAMSFVFWAVVGLTLAGAAGYWQWVRSAGPADVKVQALTRDPAGRWVYVEGHGLGGRGGSYPYAYLIDTARGCWLAGPDPDQVPGGRPRGMLFSTDGGLGVLPGSDGRGAAVMLLDLAQSPPLATRVSLESSPPPDWRTALALSPAASHVFLVHESGASMFALPSGRRVATTTIPSGWRAAVVRFVGESAARAWLVPRNPASPLAEMRVLDLAADGRSNTTVVPLASPLALEHARWWQALFPDAGGRRIVTLDGGFHLRDGATGALLATLAAANAHVATSFLSDGRVIVAEPSVLDASPDRAGTTLRLFDRDGSKLGELALDLRPTGLSLGPETAPGTLLVSSLAKETLLVDLAAGRVLERLSGLAPAGWFPSAAPATPFAAGLGAAQLFQDAAGRVVRVDFGTGARATVAGPDAPRGERIGVRW